MTTGARPTVLWPWLVAVTVAAAASILLSAQALRVLTSFHQRTAHLCDGTLPLPTSSFVYAWSGVTAAVVTAIGVVLMARTTSHRRYRPVTVAVVVILALGTLVLLLSAGWTAWDVHQDAKPVARVCGG